MIVYIDIDNTICETIGEDYKNATPIKENIDKANNIYKDGHTIVYWTARGTMKPQNKLWKMTLSQLEGWGCKFHEFKMGKPAFDILLDDKAMPINLWEDS